MDEQTRSIEVNIECQSNDKMLKPGMFATVRFIHQHNNVLVIPTSAVLQEEDKCYLFMKTGNNRFVKKPILVHTAGEKDLIVENVKSSIELIKQSGVYYEFRTTRVPGIHTQQVLNQIKNALGDIPGFKINDYCDENTLAHFTLT